MSSIIRLFDIEHGKVIPTEHCYTLAYLKDMMTLYPDEYLKIYSYLFYMCCPNPELNPFFNVPEHEKEELVLTELKAKFNVEDELIQEALKKTQKLYETRTYRLYRSFGIMLDRLGKYVEITPIAHGRDGNIGSLIQAAKNIQDIREQFKGLEKDHLEEQKTMVRGGQQLAYDQ
jgi:hypothetical protein